MLRICGAGKLATGAGSKDWRWHNGHFLGDDESMYHTGKNGVKAGKTLTEGVWTWLR
jgi:hypothetical protein